jgi:hypothetical protein
LPFPACPNLAFLAFGVVWSLRVEFCGAATAADDLGADFG